MLYLLPYSRVRESSSDHKLYQEEPALIFLDSAFPFFFLWDRGSSAVPLAVRLCLPVSPVTPCEGRKEPYSLCVK